MGSYRDKDRDRDDRPSWKEIDKRRDKSPHRKEKSEGRTSPKDQAWVKTAALKEAKAAFNKKLSPDAQKILDRIHALVGKEGFEEEVDLFIKKYGLPDDWRTLLVFLDHSDPDLFEKTASSMAETYKEQNMTDRRAFKTKLSILSNAAKSGRIQMLARKIRNRL